MSHGLEKNTETEKPEQEKTPESKEEKQSLKDKINGFLDSLKGKEKTDKTENTEKTENTDAATEKAQKEKNDFLESLKVKISPEDIKKAVEKSAEKKSDGGDSGEGRTPGEDAYDRLKDKHYLDLDD